MSEVLSPIQNRILSILKNAKSLRYSELQTEKIPNDLFNYHLQFLVKKEFIIKNKSSYSLSEKGIAYVHDPYVSTEDRMNALFKFNVIMIVSRVRNRKIEILNQLRKSHPSYGKIGVPGGVVLKGEPVESAASRKLRAETGLNADFKIVACERRFLYKSGKLFADMLFPIAYADSYSGELREDTDFGHNVWLSIDEAIGNESAEFDSIRGIVKVLKAIKNKKIKKLSFFYTEETQSDKVI